MVLVTFVALTVMIFLVHIVCTYIAVVLFLIWEWRRRNWLVLGVAALVQVVGVLFLSWISKVSPWAILADYVDIFKVFLNAQHGLRLGTLFPNSTFFAIAVPFVLTICVFGLLVWLPRKRMWQGDTRELASYEAFTVLVLWSLLVAYHGIYDYHCPAFISSSTQPTGCLADGQEPEKLRVSLNHRRFCRAHHARHNCRGCPAARSSRSLAVVFRPPAHPVNSRPFMRNVMDYDATASGN